MSYDRSHRLKAHYSNLLDEYGDSVEACQWGSPYAQQFRFLQLIQIDNLNGKSILDVGCGRGDLYGFMKSRGVECQYTGIDLVPGLIELASAKYPEAEFLNLDLTCEPLDRKFDLVMMSGLFSNDLGEPRESAEAYMQTLLKAAWEKCSRAMAFNFMSSYLTISDPELVFFDPERVLGFCIRELSRKVALLHYYEPDRGDVAVYVYR